MPQIPVKIGDIRLALEKVESSIAAWKVAVSEISSDPNFEVMVELGPFPDPIPLPGPPPPFTGTCNIQDFLHVGPHGKASKCFHFDFNDYISQLAGFMTSLNWTVVNHFTHDEPNP